MSCLFTPSAHLAYRFIGTRHDMQAIKLCDRPYLVTSMQTDAQAAAVAATNVIEGFLSLSIFWKLKLRVHFSRKSKY